MRVFDTPFGRMAVAATARGLKRVFLPKESALKGGMPRPLLPGHAPATGARMPTLTAVWACHPAAAPRVSAAPTEPDRAAKALAARAEREILEYLAGRRRRFTVPVDLSAAPPFHAKVLRALSRVPYGRTVTYGELAARVGRPRGARAVGQAMARNPVPLVVPCHRVVASGGGVGGYGGGRDLKRRLLALEGAR